MRFFFQIEDWAAFASGLHGKPEWQIWSENPYLPNSADVPQLLELPAMQRRRLERVGRIALQVSYWCQSAEVDDIPLVFASRHGDIQRTYEMLEALGRNEALSPSHFGLSIHNAVAAQYSIARKWKQNYLAVAAGKSSTEAAIIEAIGLLHDGAKEVMVVMYDGMLPESYHCYLDENCAEYAWAWRVRIASQTQPCFSLNIVETAVSDLKPKNDLPHGLEVLRFMLSRDTEMHFNDGPRQWHWQRHV